MTFIKFGYLNITGRTGDLINSEDKVLSIRKPQVRQKKNSQPFYGNRKFITVFTIDPCWFLSRARRILFV